MNIRRPVVAGQFYPDSENQCRREVKEFLADCPSQADLPGRIVAGVVPHAGWLFSGAVAAMVFAAIKQVNEHVDTFVIFGAAHRYHGEMGAVYDNGAWQTPFGDIGIDEGLAELIVSHSTGVSDCEGHDGEHSIEVQLPFIQELFSDAKIVPIATPATADAIVLGDEVGKIIAGHDKSVVCIASTDLTHYGPRYGIVPQGTGQAGIDWARDVNDAEFIELALEMEVDKLLRHAIGNSSACGPGATAGAIAAAGQLGAKKGKLLAHTTSSDVMLEKFNETSSESVGYAGMVF